MTSDSGFSDFARNALTEKAANRTLIRRLLPMEPGPQRLPPERQLAKRPACRYAAAPPAPPRQPCVAPDPLPEALPPWVPPAREGSFAGRLQRFRAKRAEVARVD